MNVDYDFPSRSMTAIVKIHRLLRHGSGTLSPLDAPAVRWARSGFGASREMLSGLAVYSAD